MKKTIILESLFIILLALIMMILLYKRTLKDIALANVDTAVNAGFSLPETEEAGAMRLKRAFGLNAADYDEMIYYAPDNTMSVNELLILKSGNEALISDAAAAFETRLSVQKKNFDGYGTDQTDLLNHAVTWTEGPYAFFAVGYEADGISKTVRDMAEE